MAYQNTIQPLEPTEPESDKQPQAGFAPPATPIQMNQKDETAANVIRGKLDRIYQEEPNAYQELQEAESEPEKDRSVHQQFMHRLSNSGKDLATIQTEWHQYYVGLNDTDKHQVWQEFYSTSVVPQTEAPKPVVVAEHKQNARSSNRYKKPKSGVARKRPARDLRSAQAIRATIRNQVSANGKLTMKHHVQSLLFGLGVGAIAIFVVLFGFFNEVVIAPFIQPSRAAAATPIIVDSSSVAPTTETQVIIPKINVQIPTDYSMTTTDEATIEGALENGIVHYPTTALPGQQGNAAFFGHSSNNIFNKGKYKFAFVLLHLMVPGDTFYLSYNGKVYVYKVISKTVVDPSEVGVLNAIPGQSATATLITCDPPGTSLKRLIVVGQQISPDPTGNSAAAATPALGSSSVSLPGNGPTLAGRLLQSGIGKAIVTILILGAIGMTIRWVNKPRNK